MHKLIIKNIYVKGNIYGEGLNQALSLMVDEAIKNRKNLRLKFTKNLSNLTYKPIASKQVREHREELKIRHDDLLKIAKVYLYGHKEKAPETLLMQVDIIHALKVWLEAYGRHHVSVKIDKATMMMICLDRKSAIKMGINPNVFFEELSIHKSRDGYHPLAEVIAARIIKNNPI